MFGVLFPVPSGFLSLSRDRVTREKTSCIRILPKYGETLYTDLPFALGIRESLSPGPQELPYLEGYGQKPNLTHLQQMEKRHSST